MLRCNNILQQNRASKRKKMQSRLKYLASIVAAGAVAAYDWVVANDVVAFAEADYELQLNELLVILPLVVYEQVGLLLALELASLSLTLLTF